jgi:hypothetical protein
MSDLCIGITAENLGESNTPILSMKLRVEPAEKDIMFPLEGKLAMSVCGPRMCIGATPPGQKLIPCPDNIIGISGNQCDNCFSKSKTLPCLRCNGERCANPARREECVQPDNHAVYLAAFASGVLKVGVARWERRYERLREQGARTALIIARDDGQKVRRIEAQIKRCGIPDRLSLGERLSCLSLPANNDTMFGELERALSGLKIRIHGSWLDEVETIILPELPSLKITPRLIHPNENFKIRGEILGTAGQIIILLSDGGEYLALDARSFIGYQWRQLDDFEAVNEQLVLC